MSLKELKHYSDDEEFINLKGEAYNKPNLAISEMGDKIKDITESNVDKNTNIDVLPLRQRRSPWSPLSP